MAEARSAPVPEDPQGPGAPWCSRGWRDRFDAWVDGELALLDSGRAGPSAVAREWPLSLVAKVPTQSGDVYAKAVCAHFAAEPRITRWLSDRFPGRVPQVLATASDDLGDRMLMAAFTSAEPTPTADLLRRTVTVLAAVQRDCLPLVGELIGVGAEDRRLALLPAALDACGLPATLVHGDMHLGNVAIDTATPGGAVPLLYDWADACVSHPLLDVAQLAEGQLVAAGCAR